MKEHKIINDPIYGLITISSELVFCLIQHPYLQRLRYIKQLGMTHLVYPGAVHTRFQHVLGTVHLMSLVLKTLRVKGHKITKEEEEAAVIAILLHDIGHGPFSHALEDTIVPIPHEYLSLLLMHQLNEQFNGQLSMAIEIFTDKYHKRFLHQLVSGQMDIDRMDYLNRDSFFTGVSEGVIGFDRIIKMLNVQDDSIVVEENGIYSVEKFLISRRLMYWQVYLHKTVVAAEYLLIKILQRARELALSGIETHASPALAHFLGHYREQEAFRKDPKHIALFTNLDDTDIISAAKAWSNHPDTILSTLCQNLLKRNLYHVEITNNPPYRQRIHKLTKCVQQQFGISKKASAYFVFTDTVMNSAYSTNDACISVLMQNGTIQDITRVHTHLLFLTKTVRKNIFCCIKGLE